LVSIRLRPSASPLFPYPTLFRSIHLSNFRPVKRALDCVRILAEVVKTVPARLLMCGDGPDRSPAEHLARDLKVDRYVSFLGKQKDRKSTRLNSSHLGTSYAVLCL